MRLAFILISLYSVNDGLDVNWISIDQQIQVGILQELDISDFRLSQLIKLIEEVKPSVSLSLCCQNLFFVLSLRPAVVNHPI